MIETGRAEDDADCSPARRVAARLLSCIVCGIGWLAFLGIVTWLFGRIVTDRFAWSQWLWWIPTPFAIAAAIVGLVAAARPAKTTRRRLRRVYRWCAMLLAITTYFAIVEHRMWRSAPTIDTSQATISIAHWNATSPPGTLTSAQVTLPLIALDADITVLTGDYRLAHDEQVKGKLGSGREPLSLATISLLSRFPIQSSQVVLAVQSSYVRAVTIDTTEKLGRAIVVYMVDMPSDPEIPRIALARKLRALMNNLDSSENAPPSPDIVIGDFNIPRGSASLRVLFPGLSHAFNQAGHGCGATYHRQWYFPMFHIDHTLLAPSMRAVRYDIVDTGVARHCAQKTWITRAGNPNSSSE